MESANTNSKPELQNDTLKTLMLEVLDSVLFYREKKNDCSWKSGRHLRDVFLELPSKQLYPDYYDVVKHPICLNMIKQRIELKIYKSLLDMKRDFTLLVENAKCYNLRNSQIYRDAVVLSRVFSSAYSVAERKLTMPQTYPASSEAPRVDKEFLLSRGLRLLDMIKSLVTSSVSNRPSFLEYCSKISCPASIDSIAKNLQAGIYTRMKDVETDILLFFGTLMQLFPQGSHIHNNACLVKRFIQNLFSQQRMQSLPCLEENSNSNIIYQRADYTIHNGQRIVPGDFAYLQNSPGPPIVARISKIWTEHTGSGSPSVTKLEAIIFQRPSEIVLAARVKFFPNELVMTHYTKVVKNSDIIKKSYVTFIVDQYHMRLPENVDKNDVFLCRFMYNADKQLTPVLPPGITAQSDILSWDGSSSPNYNKTYKENVFFNETQYTDHLEENSDGNIRLSSLISTKWFQVPPAYVLNYDLEYSLEYLYKLAKEKRTALENAQGVNTV